MEILIYGGPLEASEDWVRSEFADWHLRKPFVWLQGHSGIPWQPQTSTWLLRRPVFVDPTSTGLQRPCSIAPTHRFSTNRTHSRRLETGCVIIPIEVRL